MAYKVIEVVDGDTLRVSPAWTWQGAKGDTVRVFGYNTPEKDESGYTEAALKLTSLVLDRFVELGRVISLTYGRLLCEVTVNGQNLADFFPEYQ